MKTEILRSEYKEKVAVDDELKAVIAKALNRRIGSVDRWLRNDDVRLTTTTVLNIIREKYNLSKSVVLTEPKEPQKQTA